MPTQKEPAKAHKPADKPKKEPAKATPISAEKILKHPKLGQDWSKGQETETKGNQNWDDDRNAETPDVYEVLPAAKPNKNKLGK